MANESTTGSGGAGRRVATGEESLEAQVETLKTELANVSATLAELVKSGVRQGRAKAERTAEQYLRHALDMVPDQPEVRLLLAHVLEAQGKLDAARAELDVVVGFAPKNVEAWKTMARVRVAQGDVDGSRLAARAGLEIAPSDGELVRLSLPSICASPMLCRKATVLAMRACSSGKLTSVSAKLGISTPASRAWR